VVDQSAGCCAGWTRSVPVEGAFGVGRRLSDRGEVLLPGLGFGCARGFGESGGFIFRVNRVVPQHGRGYHQTVWSSTVRPHMNPQLWTDRRIDRPYDWIWLERGRGSSSFVT